MIRVFYGDDRVKAMTEIGRFLGEKYEVIEGVNLTTMDLPSVFQGTSLFGENRSILIRDCSENESVWNKIVDYVKTGHKVAFLETKLDKRKTGYRLLQKEGVKMQEFKMMEPLDKNLVFDIYEVALRDGKKAILMCEKIENTNDPYMFVGLLISQALKKYEWKNGEKEKRVLKELSKLDMQMKTTSIQPWILVKSFLLRVSSL